jgi:hypothetical protein
MPRTPPTGVLAANTLRVHPLDEEQYAADFTDKLPTGVTVTSAVLTQKTEAGAASTVLTLGSPTVNGSTFTNDYDSTTVAIGKGVLFTIGILEADRDAAAGNDYLVTVRALCSDSRYRTVVCRVEVRDGDED